MIGGIAHHMDQRIFDQLEHLAVELGLGPVQLELDRLAELGSEIAHHARQLLPGGTDRLHARLHDAFLQLRSHVRKPLQRRLELGILVAAHDLEQLIAGQHQLGDHGHQVLEGIHMHADRLGGDLVVHAFLLAGRSLGRWRCRRRDLAGWRSNRWRRRWFRRRPPDRRAGGELGPLAGMRLARPLRSTMDVSKAIELADQILIVARLLGLIALEAVEQCLDPVDGGENERDRLAGDRSAVAKVPHQGFGSVGQSLQPRQAEKAAGSFHGVNETKDVIENLGIVRVMLEAHELHVDDVDALVRLGQEIPQQLVHRNASKQCAGTILPAHFGTFVTVLGKGLILVASALAQGLMLETSSRPTPLAAHALLRNRASAYRSARRAFRPLRTLRRHPLRCC